MISFIIFVLLLSQTTATFPCDGVQYALGNTSVFIPAGVCKPDSDGGSEMAVCKGPNIINMASFSSDDCSGNPDSSVPMTAGFALIGVTNYEITCCTNVCDYAYEREYETLSCEADKYAAPFDDTVWAIGACMGSYYFMMYSIQCQAGAVSYDYYYYNGVVTCSGDSSFTRTKNNGDCDDSTFAQIDVTCGTAINTCSSTTTTESPTADTSSPTADTSSPTFSPTGVTISPTTSAPTAPTESPSKAPTQRTPSPTDDTITPTLSPTDTTPTPIEGQQVNSVVVNSELFNFCIVIAMVGMVV